MKLGILLCDNVDLEQQGRYGSYQDFFRHFTRSFDGFKITFFHFNLGEYPFNPKECDGYLISGSRKSIYEKEDWILRLRDFIRDCYVQRKKLAGICFGHQALAESLGGEVRKHPEGWGLGIQDFQVCAKVPWMNPEKEKVRIGLSCQDQVQILPPKAERFLVSDFIQNAGYYIPERVFSIQGHPEFNQEYIGYLLEKRKKNNSIDQTVYQKHKQTLSIKADNDLIGSWLYGFYKN